jgi:sporulation protein YlmC with PRC-barrel domain
MLTRLLATSAIVLATGGAAFAQTSSPAPSAAPSAQSGDSKATSAPSTPSTDKSGTSASDDKGASGSSEVKSSATPPVSTGSDNKSTEVKTAPPAAGTSTTSGGTTGSGSDKATASKDEPAPEKMESSHVRASKWIGKSVEGADGKDIGKVADLILDKDGKVQKVVLSVGGFLGIGDKHVALAPDQVKFGADDKLTTSMSQEQLKAHPRFEYAEDRSATPRTTGSGSTVPPARPGATGGTTPTK